jgi:hypothetical protein
MGGRSGWVSSRSEADNSGSKSLDHLSRFKTEEARTLLRNLSIFVSCELHTCLILRVCRFNSSQSLNVGYYSHRLQCGLLFPSQCGLLFPSKNLSDICLFRRRTNTSFRFFNSEQSPGILAGCVPDNLHTVRVLSWEQLMQTGAICGSGATNSSYESPKADRPPDGHERTRE